MPKHLDLDNTVCDHCAQVTKRVYWNTNYKEVLCIVCLAIDFFKRMRPKEKKRFLRELEKEVSNGT